MHFSNSDSVDARNITKYGRSSIQYIEIDSVEERYVVMYVACVELYLIEKNLLKRLEQTLRE